MKFNKNIILLMIAIFLFSITGVCASEMDDSIANDDANIMELSVDDEISVDNMQISEDNDETVSTQADADVVSTNPGNYSGLSAEIGSGGNITLTHDYYTYDSSSTILITNPGVIDGKGAIIDMAGSTIQAFRVNASGVTIKNLTIKNTNYGGDGGAIFFDNCTGTVTDCNFINNSVSGDGSAIYFDNSAGTVENCNFGDNNADYGGAVYFEGNGNLINCNFTANQASYGGAVYFLNKGNVSNCNFTRNKADNDAGAIWISSGSVKNCNLINNSVITDYSAGGAIFVYDNANITNCNFINNSVIDENCDGGAVYINNNTNIINCNFTKNTATSQGGAVYVSRNANITNCNFFNNSVIDEDCDGGALYINEGTVTYCNFTKNTATSEGGAVYVYDDINITDCNFINNSATINGGAVYLNGKSNVINSNFTGNKAKNSGAVYFYRTGNVVYSYFNDNEADTGGAVYFLDEGDVKNSKFAGNKADTGGAVYFNTKGDVQNSNFADNSATGDSGAVYFYSTGNVTNCTFINNSASNGGAIEFEKTGALTNSNFADNKADYGGAVYFNTNFNVENCNFSGNEADYGGATYFNIRGTLTNSNFIDNKADYGGAVYFKFNGEAVNCNFINNSATHYGGAIEFDSDANIINSNFTHNKADYGGAVYIDEQGDLSNCNFTGNNATAGSAIYFNDTSFSKIIHNSNFLKNRANVDDNTPFNVTLNGNNIEIIFTGQNNFLNAIYSHNPVTFYNVNYWGASGITNINDISLDGSKNEAGQNITVRGVVNGNIVDTVYITDNNGKIVIKDIAGDYYITVRHDEDSYYTEAEKIIKNMDFYANVTSMTTNNRTVNITAKSNIYNEVMPGRLLFNLPNGIAIDANYSSNGAWWIVYEFDKYDAYQIGASYVGLDGVTISNGTVTITKADSQITLDDIVLDYGDSINVNVTTKGATAITAKINNDDVNVINNYTIQISDLASGNYTLTVTTTPDEDHNQITKTVNITVNKVNSTLTLDNVVLDYGESKNVSVMTEGAAGIVAKIDGNDVSVDGFTILISDLKASNHTLTVTTVPDENHTEVTKNATVTVNKVNSTLTLDNVVLDYGESKNVAVMTDGAVGIVAKIGDKDVSVDGFTILISDLKAGNHTLTVTTVPDENHNEVTKTATVTVNKVNSTLTLDNVVLAYGESKNVSVTAEGAVGVVAKIGGNDVSVDGFTILISNLEAGNHTLTVTTVPDENHTEVTKNATVTVKINSTLNISNVELDYGESKNISVTTEGAVGIVAKIDGADVSVDGFTILISDLKAGNHTLTVSTVPDEAHIEVTKTVTVTVKKVNSTLTFDNVVLDYGESVNVSVTAEGATGIAVTIDNKNVSVSDFTILISDLKAGNHTLTVTTVPDENHTEVTKNATVTVNKVNSKLTLDNVVLIYGESNNITVITHGAVGIDAKIDDENVSVSDFTIPVSDLKIGNHTLTVSTVPDENHTEVTKTVIVSVKFNSTLNVSDVVLNYGESVNVSVTTEGATGITAKIGDNDAAVSGFVISIPIMNAGTYILTVTTITDEDHYSVTKNVTITVNKLKTQLKASAITATYNINRNLVITLKDSTGKALSGVKLSVGINSAKVYTTDKNGQVKVSTKGLAPKTYSAKITFNGNTNYEKTSINVKVTVKKATPKMTAKKKTFKRSVKTKKYSIVLKDKTGKAIKKAKLTLKVKGKTYKATTNSKGKATFKIKKLSKKGTFKAVIKYKGNKYYNKLTKKVKIKVL